MKVKLDKALLSISKLNKKSMDECQTHLDSLTKPPGSLGRLEDIALQIAGISGKARPSINHKVVLVMAGDHKVVEEGVSAYPSEVTVQMVYNFLQGGAAINVLANHIGSKVLVADVGIAEDVSHPDLIKRNVKRGSNNIAKGPAMTREEAIRAIEVGIDLAITQIENNVKEGICVLATGEMGIGNTTPSSAILSAFSGLDPEEIVGPGTGLISDKIKYKAEIVQKALDINEPDPSDGLDVLKKVGGLEIAALTGCILGAAASKMPIVIDGLISSAAALVASKLSPESVNYMIASHVSAEPGHTHMLNILGLSPMLHMNMCLGEGTGAVLAMGLIEASTKILSQMATFSDAGVSTSIE